ncbi:MAG: NAD(P)H:quinone oxidoreductase [Actinomycetota bacterium]|nr:NAD(P)H:quinone oxidoreductase [Actinomycetota bacterium]
MTDTSGTNVAIIYYSSTGNLHALATVISEAAEATGADVRLRKVAELAPPEAIEDNEQWAAHAAATADLPVAEGSDLEWADVVLFGTPTRFGNVSSQLQQFMDAQGGLWAEGKLADKVYAGFTSSQTEHGGQESTLLALFHAIHHWGGLVVSPGYTDPSKFVDGNPYGVGHVSGADNTDAIGDTERTAAEHLATRAVRIGTALKVGLAS